MLCGYRATISSLSVRHHAGAQKKVKGWPWKTWIFRPAKSNSSSRGGAMKKEGIPEPPIEVCDFPISARCDCSSFTSLA